MKHIIILGDGMADWPVESLGGKTLMQYAKTPYMDKLASMGRTGRLKTVADGFHPGSEVANMSVLGYDLPKVYEGRGPLEAAIRPVHGMVQTGSFSVPLIGDLSLRTEDL